MLRKIGKFSALLLILIGAVLLAFGAAAAHTHTFALAKHNPPTCTAEGVDVYVCTVCGEQKSTRLSALGHDFSLTLQTDREPTCATAGQRSRHCTRCDAVTDIVEIKPLAHQYRTTVVAATCTEPGFRSRVCTVCGKEVQDQIVLPLGHTRGLWEEETAPTCTEPGLISVRCTLCGVVVERKPVNATGHSFDSVIVAPTCTASGFTRNICRVCGAETQTKTVKALGHSFPANGTLTIVPTCTEKGSQAFVCTRCGATETKAVAALGHSYSDAWTVDKPATCTAQGEQSHHCIRCDKRKDVTTLPRTEHTPEALPAVAATCTAKGKTGGSRCAVCGKTLTAQTDTLALGHDEKITAATASTCTEKGSQTLVCARCGATRTQTVAALGHSYAEAWTVDTPATCTAQGEQSHHCTRCGKRKDVTALPRTEHTPEALPAVAATCTAKGKTAGSRCAVCGKTLATQTETPALGHDDQVIATLLEPTCTEKGRVIVACKVCSRAEEQNAPALGHSYSDAWTVDTLATCTAQGEQSHHCVRCGKRKDVTTLPRTEHTVTYVVETAPTCTIAGRASSAYCSVCGKALSQQTAIPATGHTPKTSLRAATTKKNGKTVTRCIVCKELLESKVIPKIASVTLSAKRFSYDGEKKTPTVTVRDADGKVIKQKDAYQLTYSAGRKKIGQYTVTVTFTGSYSGSVTRKFQVVPRKVTGVKFTSTTTTVTLQWNGVSGADGYKVYLYNPQTKYATLLGKTTKRYYKLEKLLTGAAYTYFIRAYTKTADGTMLGVASAKKQTATKPAAPTATVKTENGAAVLRWNNAGTCIYEIYAADKKNGPFVCIGTTKKTKFRTERFPAGTTKYFKIKALVQSKTATLSAASGDVVTACF